MAHTAIYSKDKNHVLLIQGSKSFSQNLVGSLYRDKSIGIQRAYVVAQLDIFTALDNTNQNRAFLPVISALRGINGDSPIQLVYNEFPYPLAFLGDYGHVMAGVDTGDDIVDGETVQYDTQ